MQRNVKLFKMDTKINVLYIYFDAPRQSSLRLDKNKGPMYILHVCRNNCSKLKQLRYPVK